MTPLGGAIDQLPQTLEDLGPEVAGEVARLLGVVGCQEVAPASIELQRLRRGRVFRAHVAGNGARRSVVIKRLNPSAAQRNRLLAQRWLPWLGLDGVAPAVLGATAAAGVELVWQFYEDVGGDTLRAHQADRQFVAAAAEMIAELHVRAAGHPVVAECRRDGEEFGRNYFTSNVQDALSLLEALQPPAVRPSPEHAALRDRLCRRMAGLMDAAPRAATIAEEGGPDTVLHGDLWASNVLVLAAGDHPRIQIIDWDHVGVGPISYDLSCFLRRFPAADRTWILDRYRDAVARSGWRLPAVSTLDLLFETAEDARYANRIIWPALALLHDQAAWGFVKLAEIEQWFEARQPLLPV